LALSSFRRTFVHLEAPGTNASAQNVSGNLPRKNEMREKAFYIGLTLIIISFIACVISFYLLVFGIPVFLVGTILVLVSNRTIKTKLFTTLGPAALYLPTTFLFLFAYNYSTPKTILIPENFNGTLRVVYEEDCGSNYEKYDGTKTLVFPGNGILVLNEEFDSHVNFKYFLVDNVGKRTKIPEILEYKTRTQKRHCVLVGSSGTMGQENGEKEITFSDFYVYNNDTIDQSDKAQQKFDSLTKVIVMQCRQDR
jgi:hypothetical protein